jgi:N-acetylneuraminic acid mutarotase
LIAGLKTILSNDKSNKAQNRSPKQTSMQKNTTKNGAPHPDHKCSSMKKQINPTIKAHLIRSAFYVILLLAVCVIPFALAQRNTVNAGRWLANCQGSPCSLGPWNIVANYPLVSQSVSVCSDGTLAYAVGGFNPNSGVLNAFNQYDPVNNTWTPLPSIPTADMDAPSVYDPNTNRVYVFGGYNISVIFDIVQIYDVASNTWISNGTPMPAGRYFAAAVYYPGDGRIYVFGGFDGVTFSEQTNAWAYDPVTNTWDTSLAPIPVGIGGAGFSIVGDFAYLQGHWNGGLGSTDNYQYDILNNSWTTKAPVPVNIYRPDSAAIGTNTYLVGGGDPKAGKMASAQSPATSFNTTYIYDTVADSWSTGPNTNVAHSFTGGTAVGNSLIVVTGKIDSSTDTNIVEKSDCGGGGTPTPTPTATATPRPTPTPRPRPTPAPRQ